MTFKCPFNACQSKPWLSGFRNQQDFDEHIRFHACQWLLVAPDSAFSNDLAERFSVCRYQPVDDNDLRRHIENHIEQNDFIYDEGGMGYCPWQTCDSRAYSCKGTKNRTHLVEHARKHIGHVRLIHTKPDPRQRIKRKSPDTGFESGPLLPPLTLPSALDQHGPSIKNILVDKTQSGDFVQSAGPARCDGGPTEPSKWQIRSDQVFAEDFLNELFL